MAKAKKKQKPGEEVNAPPASRPEGAQARGSAIWKEEIEASLGDALTSIRMGWRWCDRSLRLLGPLNGPYRFTNLDAADLEVIREFLDDFIAEAASRGLDVVDEVPSIEQLVRYRHIAEILPPGPHRNGLSITAARNLMPIKELNDRLKLIDDLRAEGKTLSPGNVQKASESLRGNVRRWWKNKDDGTPLKGDDDDNPDNVIPINPPSRQQADDADDDDPDAGGPEPELDEPDDAADELTDEQVSLMKQFVEVAPVATDTRIEQIVPLVKKDKDTEVIADRLHIREMEMYLDEDIREAINKVDPNYLSTVNRESNGSCATTSPSRRIFDIKYNIDYLFTTMYTLSPRDKRRLRKIAKRILKETKEN